VSELVLLTTNIAEEVVFDVIGGEFIMTTELGLLVVAIEDGFGELIDLVLVVKDAVDDADDDWLMDEDLAVLTLMDVTLFKDDVGLRDVATIRVFELVDIPTELVAPVLVDPRMPPIVLRLELIVVEFIDVLI